MTTLIRNGKVCFENRLVSCDILIESGRIKALGKLDHLEAASVIDAEGLLITPGLVDVHVHLREPGGEHKETIITGTSAAVKGGFTTICAMPNTSPVMDSPELLRTIKKKAQEEGLCHVEFYGTLTDALRSTVLSDYKGLKEAGVFALTNDGVGVQDAGVMYQAMKQASKLGLSVVAHTEEDSLLYGGVMHEGKRNHELGLPGMLDLSESVQIARDALLAQATGCSYHVCHVSSKESVRIIRDSKRAGIPISAEVCVHHLLLCDDDIPGDDANFKMNPPLRSSDDREALLEGFLDGTLDCLATDHAPHSADEKASGFNGSPFGIIGLEHAFSLLYTHLVLSGKMTLQNLIDGFTRKPAALFSLDAGALIPGAAADLTLIDLDAEEVITPESIVSKSANSPFLGQTVQGLVMMTLVDGKVRYERGTHA